MAAEESSRLDVSPGHGFVERLQAQRERHRRRPFIVRAMYVAAGFTLLGAGAAMLILPGPALVVIPIGLALLSLEYAWAQRLLSRALAHSEAARRRARETTTMQRVLTALAVLLALGAIGVWGVSGDIPLVPV